MTTLKREIWLVDPAGAGITANDKGVIIVKHKIIRVIATLDNVVCMFEPGELRCTQMALDKLGVMGCVSAFADHLKGVDWSEYPEDRKANRLARKHGGTVYNIDYKRRIMIITYAGDNSTLIDGSEY